MADSDIDLLWGTDLVITASGGIGTVSGGDKVIQQVVRAFLTTSQSVDTVGRVQVIPDYYFHQDYGDSARAIIDNPEDPATIEALSQLFASSASQVEGTAPDPTPLVDINQTSDGLVMNATVYLLDGSPATVPGIRVG